ncbi:hypothetical protein [Comamonas sp.]|uniref:hypothetical protein n=1 Tax=Comamonas sp. TaxID=34028 RepID=UPI002FC5C16C
MHLLVHNAPYKKCIQNEEKEAAPKPLFDPHLDRVCPLLAGHRNKSTLGVFEVQKSFLQCEK